MTSESLTRRKFMVIGSAAVASPLFLGKASLIPDANAAEKEEKKATATGPVYYIGHRCIGCQVCRMVCPESAIRYGDDRNEIDQEKCVHCGTCLEACPLSVISETELP